MALRTTATWVGVVLDTADPRGLAAFYQRLLGWRMHESSDTWVTLAPEPLIGFYLAFQLEPMHVAPVWPAETDHQQMQSHLDIAVDDVADATAFATECGAVPSAVQFQDDVRVMIDPAGHPFCLYLDKATL